jgi:adenosylhomocysteine nucleosidase
MLLDLVEISPWRAAMITAVAALEGELAGIRRQMKIASSSVAGEALIEEGWLGGQECVLVQSGMGRQRAERALDVVLQRYTPSAVLSLGFCGALAAKLRAGDLVICSQLLALLTMPSPLRPAPPVGLLNCDNRLVARALRVEMPLNWGVRLLSPRRRAHPVGGGCLTVPSAASHRQVKEWLSWNFTGAVVDMESFWLGSLAQEAGVPFLAVRAVSDPLTESLPPLEGVVDAFGRTKKSILGQYLVTHPIAAGELVRLGFHARRAQKSLTSFVLNFIKDSES